MLALTWPLAVATPADAQQIAPALEVDTGYSQHVGSGADGIGLHARGALGVQVGRVAALGVVERMVLTPGDDDLDSAELSSAGAGFAVRVDMWQRRDRFVQIAAGVTWYDLEGDEDVTRTCDQFGTCIAGWYFERPAYSHVGAHVAGSIGLRSRSDIWAGLGVRLGLTHFTLDRPGTGPDTHGILVRLSLIGVVGGQ